MVNRFLITTALEETWRDNEPVLFLGEWCRRYTRKQRWSVMDREVVPYHWDDRIKLKTDYVYIQEFYERLLLDLKKQLNQLHDVDHSVRYWRILIGPWLGYFVQILFDRWTSIKQAISLYDISETIIHVKDHDAMVPQDMSGFVDLLLGDEWNHHIYGNILQAYTNVPCILEKISLYPLETPLYQRGSSSSLRCIANSYSKIANYLAGENDVFLLDTYLPKIDELKLYCRLHQIPQLWKSPQLKCGAVDEEFRSWTVSGNCRTEFENCVRNMIPSQIPVSYLEGYSYLVDVTKKLPWPKTPGLIWSSNAYNSDEVFKAWAAEKMEQGIPLVNGQHGGHYGIGLFSFLEEHEIAISDNYLSWGWVDEANKNVQPVGQLKKKKPLGAKYANSNRALLVTAVPPRYSYWLYSIMIAGQWLEYFEDQCTFVENLPTVISEALTIRLYPRDYGWDQTERWNDRFPDIQLDSGQSNMDDLLRNCRIYIATYNATTFLESFTMNVPTIIYWNTNHWELRESAKPYFDALMRVGVFHETPQSAAQHISAVWDDVSAWWDSNSVQDALDKFKLQYCTMPDDLLGQLEVTFDDIMYRKKYNSSILDKKDVKSDKHLVG